MTWIPACAGMTFMHMWPDNALTKFQQLSHVVPAKAGTPVCTQTHNANHNPAAAFIR